jgi:hypothetical protein
MQVGKIIRSPIDDLVQYHQDFPISWYLQNSM